MRNVVTLGKFTKQLVFALLLAAGLPNGAQPEETRPFDFPAYGNWGLTPFGKTAPGPPPKQILMTL
jgi:hypothetical protein